MTFALRFSLRAAALGAALLCGAAQAQQAWVLTTDEANATYRNNIFAAVENAYGAGNVIDGRTALNSSTPLGVLPADVNLVVIGMLGTNTTGLNAARWAEVQNLIAAPGRELTVAWFIDGAVSARHANSGELLSLLNDQLGYTGTADAMSTVLHTNTTGGSTFHRNPTTALSAGLPDTLGGGVYTAFRNVFGQYTIYLEGGAGNPAPTIPATNTEKTSPGAYGLMLPRAALQNQQTCVFAFGDISPFSSASARLNTLMAGIGAAAGTGGLCTSTAVPHPDLVPTVTAPSGLAVGGTGTVAVDVRNQGLVDSTNGSLTISLPAGLELDPAGTLPAGCTATSSTAVDCTLSTIAAGTSMSLSLPVRAIAPIATALPITATVQSVTGELAPQQSNNSHSASVTVGTAPIAAGQLTAVPTLDAWGLGALAAALGALGMRRQRRRAQDKPSA